MARSPQALIDQVWPPMLATLSEPSEARGAFVFEVKYDGFRALAGFLSGKLGLFSRNGLDLAPRFPEVAWALGALGLEGVVLDGEIIAEDASGRSSFEHLADAARRECYVAFDLLMLAGKDVRALPLQERRRRLEKVLKGARGPILLAERVAGDVEDALAEARRRGLEGVIAKRCDAPYRGARSGDWLKLKLQANQEAAIVGFTPSTRGGAEIGALLLAVRGEDGFVYAGKVGTGFTDQARRELRAFLVRDRVAEPAVPDAPRMKNATWVKPRLVAQLAFTEWTRDGRMRHPSFQGLRDDKRPEDCVRERPQGGAQGRARREGASPVRRASRSAPASRPPAE